MATSTAVSLLSFAICLSLLCRCSVAQLGFDQGRGAEQPWEAQRPRRDYSRCQLERLSALDPMRRVPSEAGFTEYFDQYNQQLQCAGVAVRRRTIQPRGLLLPYFSNAPSLVYIVQGRGITGTVIPGCPETYQSFQQTEQPMVEEEFQSQRFRDEHQRVRYFREGDVMALPAGVAHWFYNHGEVPVIAITVSDTSSSANQLDRLHREFLLAGRERRAEQGAETEERQAHERKGLNLFNGFDRDLLAEALGVDKEVVRKIQNPEDKRGDIVRVERGLQVLQPSRRREQSQEQEQEREEREESQERRGCESNGLEEAYCTLKNRQNIGDPIRADYYNPQAGRITTLNSQKLPLLRYVQLSAERGVLRRNAFAAPQWNINAHSIVYALRGRGKVQVVGHRGRTVFDGELRQGQLLVVPQHYAVLKQAQSESFEWISFKTNDNAMVSQIVGKASAFRGMPVEVLMNSYRISREEAKRLKFNRGNEMSIFTPKSQREEFPRDVIKSVAATAGN